MKGGAERELHTLVGRSGSGKTLLMRALLGQSNRAVCLDLIGNLEPGLIVHSRNEALEYLHGGTKRFRVIYRPPIDLADREAVYAEANWLCHLARALGPCEIFLDEIDSFCDGETIPPQLDLLVRYGRNIEVTLRGAARRPAVVIPRHFVSETTRWSIFHCADPYDLSFLERYTGIPKEKISALPPLSFFDWNQGTVTKRKIAIPR